jgi:hypothetical protein
MREPTLGSQERSSLHPPRLQIMVPWVIALIVLGIALVPGRSADAHDCKVSVCWTWTRVKAKGHAPSTRWGHSAVWTGSEMLVFGGEHAGDVGPFPVNVVLDDLWSYTPATKTWKQLHPLGGPPPARVAHTAVWTGSEMLVYGGFHPFPTVLNDVWAYHPSSNTWEEITLLAGGATRRSAHTAVWDPRIGGMLVFGGIDVLSNILANPEVFLLSERRWLVAGSDVVSFPPARYGTAAVFSDRPGNRGGMWLFGGCHGSLVGFADTWQWLDALSFTLKEVSVALPEEPVLAPSARCLHSAVIIESGSRSWMVIFGGVDGFRDLHDLHYLNLIGHAQGDWFTVLPADKPQPRSRQEHTAVWTGTEMLVFGGRCSPNCQRPVGNALWSLRPPPSP